MKTFILDRSPRIRTTMTPMNWWTRSCATILIVVIIKFAYEYRILHNFLSVDNSNIMHNQHNPFQYDRQWLESIRSLRKDEIPIVIVEEHYEVLNYWFQAAELGLIPKSGNVLLHIDAHVDGAIPYDMDAIPWFRFPRNDDEIYKMMQRNDMFIVAAAVTDFVDHFIWVWPSWDEDSHNDEDWSHIKVDVELGIVKTVKKSYLCACLAMSGTGKEKSENRDWKCNIKNTTCYEGSDCPNISRSQCLVRSKAIIEIVSESLAKNVVAEQIWSGDKGLILDIDQDYFGTWSDVIPLYDAGMSQKNIDVLSDLVSYPFCVFSAGGEILVDRIYFTILSLIKELKSKSCAGENVEIDACLNNIEIENFLIENEDSIITYIKSESPLDVLCGSEEKVEGLFFQSLLHFLLNFNLEQLKFLEELGICLKISPSSPNFPSDGTFHVCHGDNIPNKTLIPFHLPNAKEVNIRTEQLNYILSELPKEPQIITISRSVRDGYTPKALSNLIESSILTAITKSFRRANASSVHYDSYLLGGKHGWGNRSQPLDLDLVRHLAFND